MLTIPGQVDHTTWQAPHPWAPFVRELCSRLRAHVEPCQSPRCHKHVFHTLTLAETIRFWHGSKSSSSRWAMQRLQQATYSAICAHAEEARTRPGTSGYKIWTLNWVLEMAEYACSASLVCDVKFSRGSPMTGKLVLWAMTQSCRTS